MNKHQNSTNNLLFLLAAAPMGLGCIIVTDDTDETEGADTNGNQTSTTGTTGEATAGTDTPVTGGGTGTDSTGRTDSSGVDSTAGSGDTTTGGISGVCADYGALAVECMQPYAEYAAENCAFQLDYLEMYSPECADAYTLLISCLSALSCEELQSDLPCQTELDGFLALGCPVAE